MDANQAMFLSMIKVSAFPEMDIERITSDLANNEKLWLICTVEKKGVWKKDGSCFASLSLSDFAAARGKEDALTICSTNLDNDKLFEIAKGWGADNVEWQKKRTNSDTEPRVLELWWGRKF